MGHTRIFIGLTEIAGYHMNLKRGFESLGYTCTFVNLRPHPFGYGGDDVPFPFIRIQQWANLHLDASSGLVRILLYSIILFFNIPLFLWALAKHDVFIFGYASTFFGFFELPILKLFGKRIIYIFFGSDERPTFIDGALMATYIGSTIEGCIRHTAKQKRRLKRIERYADALVGNPASAHLHEKRLVQWLAIGMPLSSSEMKPREVHRAPQTVRILHAPSSPKMKGSDRIRMAIRSLQEKGYSIEYVEVAGKPHDVVLEELQACDFVIDQVYSDTPMAMFAAEAAAFGKPAVVGGYYANQIHMDVSEPLIPPGIYCHPDQIAESAERLIVDEKFRLDIGRKARAFVREKWNPTAVAKRYVRVIDGATPDTWFFDPYTITYLCGAGMHERQVRDLVNAVVEVGGVGALQLTDKPTLEQRFREFCEE